MKRVLSVFLSLILAVIMPMSYALAASDYNGPQVKTSHVKRKVNERGLMGKGSIQRRPEKLIRESPLRMGLAVLG